MTEGRQKDDQESEKQVTHEEMNEASENEDEGITGEKYIEDNE